MEILAETFTNNLCYLTILRICLTREPRKKETSTWAISSNLEYRLQPTDKKSKMSEDKTALQSSSKSSKSGSTDGLPTD